MPFSSHVNSPWCHPSAAVPVQWSHTDACRQCLEGHCGHHNVYTDTICDQTWTNQHYHRPQQQINPGLSVFAGGHIQQQILTICLKYIPAAWTGRSSRRGSNLGAGERKADIVSIIIMKTEECADCHPRLLELIIWLKINRQSLCGWRVNETIHENCSQQHCCDSAPRQGQHRIYIYLLAEAEGWSAWRTETEATSQFFQWCLCFHPSMMDEEGKWNTIYSSVPSTCSVPPPTIQINR